MNRGWMTSGAPAGDDSVAKRISGGHLGETRDRHPAPAQRRQTPRGILKPAPWTIEDADAVDARRGAVGLPPLAEQIESARAVAEAEGELRPADPAGRRREAERWARS